MCHHAREGKEGRRTGAVVVSEEDLRAAGGDQRVLEVECELADLSVRHPPDLRLVLHHRAGRCFQTNHDIATVLGFKLAGSGGGAAEKTGGAQEYIGRAPLARSRRPT